MSVPRIFFTKHDGKGTYSGYVRYYEPNPEWPWSLQWEGKRTGIDFDRRIFKVSDSIQVARVGQPNKRVFADGYGADIKYAYYLREAGKETPESKACIEAFEAERAKR